MKLKFENDKSNNTQKEKSKKGIQKSEETKNKNFNNILTFFINLIILLTVVGFVFKDIKYFPLFYSVLFPILMIQRTYEFFCTNQQFMLFELCYFINLLLFTLVVFLKKNEYIFFICYYYSMGPIIFSIFLFKNCFVFHSTLRMTSSLIHLCPAISMLYIRWYDSEHIYIDSGILNKIHFNFTYLYDFIKINCSFWLFWATIYYVVIFYLAMDYIKNKNCITLYGHYLTDKNKLMKQHFTLTNKKLPGVDYLIHNSFWVFSNLIIGLFSYFSFELTVVIILFNFLFGLWETSKYYIRIISVQ